MVRSTGKVLTLYSDRLFHFDSATWKTLIELFLTESLQLFSI